MASSFIRIFRSKRRNKIDDSVSNEPKSSDANTIPTWRSSKDGIYVGGTSWTRPSAPYSIITSPKKSKKSRSCPGGVLIPSYKLPKIVPTKAEISNCSKLSEGFTKASEYGKCEENPSKNLVTVNGVRHQTDSDKQSSLIKIYEYEIRKLKRRMKEDRLRFRDQVLYVQRENDELQSTIEKLDRSSASLQRRLQYEQLKMQHLRGKFRELQNLNKKIDSQLDSYKKQAEKTFVNCPSCESHCAGAGEALCLLPRCNGSLYDYSSSYFINRTDDMENASTGLLETASSEENCDCSSWTSSEREKMKIKVVASSEIRRNSSRSRLRRSLSDSQLPSLIAEARQQIPSEAALPTTHRMKTRGEWLRRDVDASFSSDENSAIELIGRQLRHRGDCVRFIPPRRTVRSANFRRFGRCERRALAEFDYLLDLSTDISSIVSSPDIVHSN